VDLVGKIILLVAEDRTEQVTGQVAGVAAVGQQADK
jgi:hypothetical protein